MCGKRFMRGLEMKTGKKEVQTSSNGKHILSLWSKIVQSYFIDGHLFLLHNNIRDSTAVWCHILRPQL